MNSRSSPSSNSPYSPPPSKSPSGAIIYPPDHKHSPHRATQRHTITPITHTGYSQITAHRHTLAYPQLSHRLARGSSHHPYPIFVNPDLEHTHNFTPNGSMHISTHTHTHTHTHTYKLHSLPLIHQKTGSHVSPPLPAVTSTNGLMPDTRVPTLHCSHAQRARPSCTPGHHAVFRDLAASCPLGPVSPTQLTGLRLGQKLQGNQEQAKAGPRLAQAPATPHPRAAHTQGGGPVGVAARRGDSTGLVHSRGGRLQSGSAGDCPRPRPGLALCSSARPGGARWRGGNGGGGADSWSGELGKFVQRSDWPAKGGVLGREPSPSCPTPRWRRRVTPTQP